jgi:hypothetical protein
MLTHFWEDRYEPTTPKSGKAMKKDSILEDLSKLMGSAGLTPPSLDELVHNSQENIKSRLSAFNPSLGVNISGVYKKQYFDHDLENAITYKDSDTGKVYSFGTEFHSRIRPALKITGIYNSSVSDDKKMTKKTPLADFCKMFNSSRFQYYMDARTPSGNNDGKSKLGEPIKSWPPLKKGMVPLSWLRQLFTEEFLNENMDILTSKFSKGMLAKQSYYVYFSEGGLRSSLLGHKICLNKDARDVVNALYGEIESSAMETNTFENLAGPIEEEEVEDMDIPESDKSDLRSIADLNLNVKSDVRKGLDILANPKYSKILAEFGITPEKVVDTASIYEILANSTSEEAIKSQIKSRGISIKSYSEVSKVVKSLKRLRDYYVTHQEEEQDVDMMKSEDASNLNHLMNENFWNTLPKNKAYRRLIAKLMAERIKNLVDIFGGMLE